AGVEQLEPALVDRRGGVVHRPDQAELVRHSRQLREQLAQVYARHPRRDRPERAADLARGVRLRVERVEVGRPADEVDEDAGLGRPGERGARAPGYVTRDHQAGGPGGGRAEEVAAVRGAVVRGHGKPRGLRAARLATW